MQYGRGTVMLRSTAGAITSLGLVLLLIALVVVPAAPVLAATPTLDVSTACDGNDHVVYWTTTSTDPTSDGGDRGWGGDGYRVTRLLRFDH